MASEAKIRVGEINESRRNGKGMEIGLGRKAKGERRKEKGETRDVGQKRRPTSATTTIAWAEKQKETRGNGIER